MTKTYTIVLSCSDVSYTENVITFTVPDAYTTLFDKLVLGSCKGMARVLQSSAVRQFLDTILGWLS